MYCIFQWIIKFVSLHFSGKKEIQAPDNEGEDPKELYLALPCRSMQRVGGYSLTTDDPAVFTDKITFVDLVKEFPEPYPPGADSETPPPQAVPSGSQAKEVPQPKKEMVAMLSRMHFELTKLAKNAGVKDLCALEKGNRLENIIAGLTSKDLVCKYCKKQYSSLTNLKNHLRLKHLKRTAHYCDICKKYFSEATTLRNHMVRHEEGAREWRCTVMVRVKKGKEYVQQVCNKVFYSQSKYADHSIVHTTDKPFLCDFCKVKRFKREKSLKEHLEKCDDNPNKADRVKCRLCPKDYADQKSLRRHFRSAHPGENVDL